MLFVSILLFFAAFAISYYVKNFYQLQKITSRLNAEIHLAQKELSAEILKVSEKDLENSENIIHLFDEKYHDAFEKEGIEILVYRNDSLRYWTSNEFAAPIIRDSENYVSEMVKSGSGYFLVEQKKVGNFTIIGLQLICYNYQYRNDYLPTGFFKRFSTPDNISISFQQSAYNITNNSGNFLFSIDYTEPFEIPIWIQYLIFALYITSFLIFCSASYTIYSFLMHDFGQKWMVFVVFVSDIIILRALQYYFRFPADLYHTQLFNPEYFASSDLLPSLGDFFINIVLLIHILFIAYRLLPYWISLLKNQGYTAVIVTATLTLLLAFCFYYLNEGITGLIANSSISFRFENILNLPHSSHFGILIIALLIVAFLFITEITAQFVANFLHNKFVAIAISTTTVLLFLAIIYLNGSQNIFPALIFLVIVVLIFLRYSGRRVLKLRLSKLVVLMILLSVWSTYLINKAETDREHEQRILLAAHLADARDNLAEYYFKEASQKMKNDSVLLKLVSEENSETDELSRYILQNYFSGYWNKYQIQVTACFPDKKLSIKPGNVITGCEEYFSGKIQEYMKPVSVPGLYFLRQTVDAMYYLGKIVLPDNELVPKNKTVIFVEISSNNVLKGIGYPELLVDSKNAKTDNLYGYSYAFYYKGELVKNVGKYAFDLGNKHFRGTNRANRFIVHNGYSHLIYTADADIEIILSKESGKISDFVSPFSYIFLLLILLFFIVQRIESKTLKISFGIYTFRLRLQIIMILVIVLSSIVLVTVSLLFINRLNKNKNNEILSEKLNSVLVALETRYGNIHSFEQIDPDELSDLLVDYSNTYFTDVNIYSTGGFLLASSRDQIFMEGMISEQLNTRSVRKLITDKGSYFIQNENIGSYSFLSAYSPARNRDNQLLGFVNLPYFAKQEDIRREISGLISAFANIYIIMILITVFLALLLSRYITKPLQHIGNQFSMIKIGDKNAKITWNRRDEIGKLVEEYNRMIDEMEKSAELLARSERESAWRQMARQVAHEIKNPLTPIKLSMQLLMRAWNDQAPDWEVRLKRFSQTLIMQIDTLSSIATEFSDFAQMPEPQIQNFDVIPLVQQSAALFRDQSDCEITFETRFLECIILADPNQILRVFNNLIKNALQAIPPDRQGVLRIVLEVTDSSCQISFQDNGSGIPTDRQTRIFSPNFTTKTAGMGLGLAMVKNIIDSSSGRIWFETDPGAGTTFYVSLPLHSVNS